MACHQTFDTLVPAYGDDIGMMNSCCWGNPLYWKVPCRDLLFSVGHRN